MQEEQDRTNAGGLGVEVRELLTEEQQRIEELSIDRYLETH